MTAVSQRDKRLLESLNEHEVEFVTLLECSLSHADRLGPDHCQGSSWQAQRSGGGEMVASGYGARISKNLKQAASGPASFIYCWLAVSR